jgi:hypothetical protein
MEKQNFRQWLFKGATTLPKLVILIVPLISGATLLVNHLLTLDKAALGTYLAVLQSIVCFILFALVPKPTPPHNSLLLKTTDIIAPHNLMLKLQTQSGPNKLLLSQLRISRARIERYFNRGPVDTTFLSGLVNELNDLIKGNSLIYDTEIFEEVRLSDETLKICRSTPIGTKRVRANRMVLEDLFSEEITQYPRNEEVIKRACRNIRLWIQLMFLCWAVYYGVTAISKYSEDLKDSQTATSNTNNTAASPPQTPKDSNVDIKKSIFDLILNSFSVLTTVFIFFLYIEMAELTVEENTTGRNQHLDSNSQELVRDAFNQKAVFACIAFLVICINQWFGQKLRGNRPITSEIFKLRMIFHHSLV